VFINFPDVDDRTALQIAAWQGFTQAVSELKQAKLISNIAGATL
jgi:ankyrin repeat protein